VNPMTDGPSRLTAGKRIVARREREALRIAWE
jgi:hypothetical protein